MCNVRVASDDSYKDRRSGERIKRTEWHRVAFFDKSAEAVAKYGAKGRSIFVSGPSRTRKVDNGDGVDRYYTEIRAVNWRFLGPPAASTTGTSAESTPSSEDFDDDIPF